VESWLRPGVLKRLPQFQALLPVSTYRSCFRVAMTRLDSMALAKP
jgi:hypothetical protein